MPTMRGRIVVLLVALAAPGLLLLPVWLHAGLGAGEDDVLYYLPARMLLHEFARDGVLPWLNPWTGLDRPFLADPQTAVFYPPSLLFVLAQPLAAYGASLWLHYSLALLGMYVLLRGERLGLLAAGFGALAFAFCGPLLAHRAHLTFVHSAAWTPWVFWSLRHYAHRGQPGRLAATGAFIALQCLAGHVQVAALTALGSFVWLAGRYGWRRGVMARWLCAWLMGAGLFAVQWVPTLCYVAICTRPDRGYLDFTENSWNPLSAVGFLLPMFFGQRVPNFFDTPYWGPSHQSEQFAYAGVAVLLLALPMLRGERRWRRAVRGYVWLAGGALLLALGLYGPVCPVLYWLPGARLFRVPARALLLVNLALAALAARALRELAATPTPGRARLRAALLALTARPLAVAVGVPLVLALPFALAAPLLPADLRAEVLHSLRPWNPALWVPACVLFVSLATVQRAVRQWSRPHMLAVLLPLLAIDLGIVGWSIDVPPRWTSPQRMLHPPQRTAWMRYVRPGSGRLWVVTRRSGSRPGEYVEPLARGVSNTNVLDHVPALTDYGPLQPRRFVKRFDFKPWGEAPQAARLLADSAWTADCNLGWVLLCDPSLSAPDDAEPVASANGLRLYRVSGARGDVFVSDASLPHAITTVHEAPYAFRTRIAFWPVAPNKSRGGGPPQTVRVVASRLALPGWSIRVNGRPATPRAYEDLLLTVDVPPQDVVEIEWRYFPPGLLVGATISVATAAALALLGAVQSNRTRQLRSTP